VARLYEQVAHASGALPATVTLGIALNTELLDDDQAREAVDAARRLTGLPATDAVRFGVEPLLAALGC
jgi:uncharacterized NAD-dependent epimerase/dehydratase family protein